MTDPEEMKNSLIDAVCALTSDLKSKIQGYIPGILQLDGREMRETGRSKGTKHPGRNTNMLNIWDPVHEICLASEPVDSMKNEIPKAQERLYKTDLINGKTMVQYKDNWYLVPLK